MIEFPGDIDLGKDESRIKDPRDADRQKATAKRLLERFFHDDLTRRWELQLVADEVGMGKTYVALSTAYAVLGAMRDRDARLDDLEGCQARVLVIAPQNAALVGKWTREVGEFVKRCWTGGDESGEARHPWFHASEPIERLDDLAAALCDDESPAVLVTNMGVLGAKFRDYDLKRRYLLGHLCRAWSNRLPIDARARMLKGAPEGWPKDPRALLALTGTERAALRFDDARFRDAVDAIAQRDEGDAAKRIFEATLALCQKLGEPYARDRGSEFREIETQLVKLYRHVCFAAVTSALPLVIVDEAHNWKNGPRAGTNGYGSYSQFIAPNARRALLLTATPFQLRPEEMGELLKAGDALCASPSGAASRERARRLAEHREKVIEPVLHAAARQSRAFSAMWSAFPARRMTELDDAWNSERLTTLRATLRDLARAEGVVEATQVQRAIDGALAAVDPDLRGLLREALRLYTLNEDLSQELGALVIRHRRRTDHRLVRVGSEYTQASATVRARADRNVLHAAAGIDVRGAAELPHYLLMRLVSLTKSERGRGSLGTALTGCYSTLHNSAEGRLVGGALRDGDPRAPYLKLLRSMTTEGRDEEHPKVSAVVDAVVSAWKRGEKTLIFCFRTHTSKRLQAILDARIKGELHARRNAVIGGGDALTRLRGRFTRRDGDLVPLSLDRVLWSVRWAAWRNDIPLPEMSESDLRLTDDED